MKVFAIELLEQIENEIEQIENTVDPNNFGDFSVQTEFYYEGVKRGLKAAHDLIFVRMYKEDGARDYDLNTVICRT